MSDETPASPADPYVELHPGDENPNDPGFCRCGLGLQAYRHTDSTQYTVKPLSEWFP